MSSIPFGNRPNQSGKIISGWYYDKKSLDPHFGLFKKLEVFRYFKSAELPDIVKFVNGRFTPAPDYSLLPKSMRLVLAFDKTYYRNKGGRMQTFDAAHLDRANLLPPDEYIYENLFMLPIVHRGAFYLVRIYHLALDRDNRDQIKLEITFFDDDPKDRRGYKANRLKTTKKINAMQEIINRFDKQFKHGEFLDHTRDKLTILGLKHWRTKEMKSIYEQD